jgi:DNA-binding response OmpR family regulator
VSAAPRVLIVEDEPGLRLTLSDRLGSEGYSVETASDGEAGLARATSGGYDLIVLDVMLPRMNGFDVCREARQRGVRTPILMLTARGQVVDKVVGLKLGADDYLTKPFETIELMARLEALLRRRPPRPCCLPSSWWCSRSTGWRWCARRSIRPRPDSSRSALARSCGCCCFRVPDNASSTTGETTSRS